MYKLLLASDQKEVLDAFDRIQWDYNGFRKPHIRQDLDGVKECMKAHRADAVVVGFGPEKKHELLVWLRAVNPYIPVCEAGRTPEEAAAWLQELNTLLNWIRADFSSDHPDQGEMLVLGRRNLFRSLVSDRAMTKDELRRGMLMRRSRFDPNSPVVLMTLSCVGMEEGSSAPDRDRSLEKSLFRSLGGDIRGYHVLPLVTGDGRIFVLAGPVREHVEDASADDMRSILEESVREGILHAEEYQGLQMRITGIEVLPSLYALCADGDT
ncbi:MAG: hypothetical protein IKE24_10230 [Clostridia bacterium]|nr:hypothetical protein [Clostridia bacterium]